MYDWLNVELKRMKKFASSCNCNDYFGGRPHERGVSRKIHPLPWSTGESAYTSTLKTTYSCSTF